MQVFAISATGLSAAFRRFSESAERTARMADPSADVDYAAEAVEQIQAKQAVSANVSVIKTADEMLGRLLDIRA